MKSIRIIGGTVVTEHGQSQQDLSMGEGASETLDVPGALLFPGFIDCHVHFREPGMEQKGTMASEARAARAGGITTVCDMPNTIPPTVTVTAFQDKVRRAQKVSDCDIRFFFGATEQAHLKELRTLWSDPKNAELKSRCCGLKLYLDHSTGNQKAKQSTVEEAFALCAELGIPLIAHCEDPDINKEAFSKNTRTDIAAHSIVRPAEAEVRAVQNAIALAREHGTQFHVTHLSTGGALEIVRKAKKEGLPITCDVTPHHLFLSTDDYDRLGTRGKMNPPLRSKENVAALWRGISDGTVDCIASDHAPHTLDEKRSGEPLKAPSGVPGVATMIPLLLNAAAQGKITYSDIVRLCFERPNTIFHLGKTAVKEGKATDIVIVDPTVMWEIRATELPSPCGWTPYEGMRIQGKITHVLRGES